MLKDMVERIIKRLPNTRVMFTLWLLTLYIVMGHSLLTGEYQYRMAQAADYIGNFPMGFDHDLMVVVLTYSSLTFYLLLITLGSFLVAMENQGRSWALWPLTFYCALVPIWFVRSNIRLNDVYYQLVDFYDWILCSASVVLFVTIIVVAHLKRFTHMGPHMVQAKVPHS